ncbi:carbamoyltransferase HypF [Natronincola ferrireducens]|uniref:Carbamoyltransferase n=1 Tax=Natronincola ferrireducens TaxID=393762 RepID=A0A1G9GCP0_9FIRM|nr:carbamoyltransferase HypF [Natronincola ferrireducens]SDK98456.1 Hydrogenase maturation protein, carbamoyltransferase HypF [Natronincola ferrireducens]
MNHNNPVKDIGKRRYIIKIYGIVQGVGYRPQIYNQAKFFNIKGWVTNQGSAVVLDIEGERAYIRGFLIETINNPPSLATVEKIHLLPKEYKGYLDFQIKSSTIDEKGLKFIGADVATCPQCLEEIFNTHNPRYHYPFTNCTVCGPRYSILRKLPYDRNHTTMDAFQMCSSCKEEYNDPTNRRFHAQPNCCLNCGPSLHLLTNEGMEVLCIDSIDKTIELLQAGKIVAIKGLGGYHLTCDAENQEAIKALRKRKNRPHKPFALMVKNMEVARELCRINEVEEKVLLSNKRPIVLLKKKGSKGLPDEIAPNMERLGAMLPYTPLHYLLFQRGITALVMTSGNQSSAPIQYKNHEAIENLGGIADYFLIHNRDIHIPVEDSVVKVVNDQEIVVRRARGYTPFSFPINITQEVLALGAEEKSTFCAAQNQYGYMSQYLGDLKDFDTYGIYEKAIKNLVNLLGLKPKIIAHDLNTSYISSQYAEKMVGEKVAVQHHHAHMVSCMVEYNLFSPMIGVVFDGTGLGTDGKIWGGEFFVGTRESFSRVGHLRYVTIQGGNQAIKEPWRVAISYMYAIDYQEKKVLREVDEKSIHAVTQALDQNLNCFQSSSMGRLFDCVASILNLPQRITYDAQAAIELENILDPSVKAYYAYHIGEENGVYQIDYKGILMGVLKDIEKEVPASAISAKFHNTIGNVTLELISRIKESSHINNVVLSGGVFENTYLLSYVVKGLEKRGYDVYYHRQIPTNDSGISVGQLGVAAAIEGMG